VFAYTVYRHSHTSIYSCTDKYLYYYVYIIYIYMQYIPVPLSSRVRDASKRSTAVCLRSWTLFSVYLGEREYYIYLYIIRTRIKRRRPRRLRQRRSSAPLHTYITYIYNINIYLRIYVIHSYKSYYIKMLPAKMIIQELI